MKEKKQTEVLLLYTELAGYTVACINRLAEEPISVTVVYWPVNPEAPFEFDFHPNVRYIKRAELNKKEVVDEIVASKPDVTMVSGWVDNTYVSIAKRLRKTGVTVLGFDNPWKGTLRQRLGALLMGGSLRRVFTHCWVAGPPQMKFAKKLGFHSSQIQQGCYSADTERFSQWFRRKEEKPGDEPLRFLYVGRYVPHKGIFELWNAFIEALNNSGENWELWCVGTGTSWDERVPHEAISHFGFVQPAQLEEYVQSCDVFVLPSREEPWGVVVQEMAAAGMPLLLSDKVGAGSVFLKNGWNGYLHRAGNESNLREEITRFMKMNRAELREFGRRSHEKSDYFSPAKWAKQVLSFTEQKQDYE